MSDQHTQHFDQAQTERDAAHIRALIAAADAERWLEWHGPSDEQLRHKANADMMLEQLRLLSIGWAQGVGRC
jgi:hypothetical protein